MEQYRNKLREEPLDMDVEDYASRALLDAFWSWVENTISIPTTNEKLTKALNYSLNNKKELEMFLKS